MNSNINKLFTEIKKQNIDLYILFLSDPHLSEYLAEKYQSLKYITNFTGSNGTAVFDSRINKVYFLTDGRYVVQAKKELDNDVELVDINVSLFQLLETLINKSPTLAFNGDEVSIELGTLLVNTFADRTKQIITNIDIIPLIYKQPSLPNTTIYVLEDKDAGLSSKEKIAAIRLSLKKANCDSTFISSLTDIAWITNMRANDVSYNTVFYAYLYIDMDKAILLINKDNLNDDIRFHLKKSSIDIKDYSTSHGFIPYGRVLLDPNRTTYYFANKFAHVKLGANPSLRLKAIKNPTEIKNMEQAHLEDAVALIKFIKWVKTSPLHDEYYVSEKLESFRKESPNYLFPSFATIAGFNENGAIVHYAPTKENNKKITGNGLLLVDSGGQYKYGTTDITRTIVIKHATKEQKYHFTLVLKASIQLHMLQFIQGCTGQALDVISRNILWKEGLDYKHGTGHGIGYFNSVHEGPNSFRYMVGNNKYDDCTLSPNMLTSIEPGLYFENQYGIRHENIVKTVFIKQNNNDTFLGSTPLTLVPFDLDGIQTNLLTKEEKEYLNSYHLRIVTNPFIREHLSKEELAFLQEITKPI